MTERQERVKIRYTHPNLYRLMMTLSFMSVGLAVNLWRSNPTFNPYGIDKTLVALIFCLLGISQIIFLNIGRLRAVRIGMALSSFTMVLWGWANTEQAFAGNASFQLPILYVALGVMQFLLLIEPPVNPVEQRPLP